MAVFRSELSGIFRLVVYFLTSVIVPLTFLINGDVSEELYLW